MIEETRNPWQDFENTNLSQAKWDIGARVSVFEMIIDFIQTIKLRI